MLYNMSDGFVLVINLLDFYVQIMIVLYKLDITCFVWWKSLDFFFFVVVVACHTIAQPSLQQHYYISYS